MTQEEKKDEDHQHDPFDQRIPHRIDGRRDQLDAVVEGQDLRACGEDVILPQIVHLDLDRFDHLTRIASANHENRAGHNLPLAVKNHGPMANGVADENFRDITNEDRCAAGLFHDDGLDIVHILDQAQAADDRTFGVPFQHVAPGVGIVLCHRLIDIVKRQVELAELGRIDQDLILLHKPAHAVHIDHARHALEQRAQDPVLHRALIRQLLLDNRGIGRRRMWPFHIIVIDLAQPRSDGAHDRLQPHGQSLLRRHDPFEHQLASKVRIHVVVEHDRDLGQGEF